MPSLHSLTFSTSGLRLRDDHPSLKSWLTRDDDIVSLDFFNTRPNIPATLTTLDELRALYVVSMKDVSAKLLEFTTITLSSCHVIRLIIKSPLHPVGRAYLGSFTIPFADFSFVIKAQCHENAATDAREQILFDRLRITKKIQVDPAGAITDDWNPDSQEYDPQFPKHPITRLRKLMKQIETTCLIDPATKLETPFELPVQ